MACASCRDKGGVSVNIRIRHLAMAFIVLSLVGMAWGVMQLPQDLLLVLGGWALLAWFAVALALFLGPLSEKSPLVSKLWSPFSYITFPLSGAAFLVGTDRARIVAKARELLSGASHAASLTSNPFGDGHAAARIRRAIGLWFATGSRALPDQDEFVPGRPATVAA